MRWQGLHQATLPSPSALSQKKCCEQRRCTPPRTPTSFAQDCRSPDDLRLTSFKFNQLIAHVDVSMLRSEDLQCTRAIFGRTSLHWRSGKATPQGFARSGLPGTASSSMPFPNLRTHHGPHPGARASRHAARGAQDILHQRLGGVFCILRFCLPARRLG